MALLKEWLQICLLIPLVLALILISQWSLAAGLFAAVFFASGYLLLNRLILDSPGFIDASSFIRSTFLKNDPDFRILTEEQDFFLHEKEYCATSPKCTHESPRNRVSSCSICDTSDCVRDKSSVPKPPPWQGLLVPKIVDYALLEFIELTLRTYVHDWYFSEISDDQAFLIEIRYQIRYILAKLYRKIKEKDLTEFIFSKIVPVAATHAEMYSKVRQHFGKDATPEMLEQRVLDFMRPAGGLHKALYNRDSELDYLRSLADFAVNVLADKTRLVGDDVKIPGTNLSAETSNNPKFFLRDLAVFALFVPIMDTIADPDIINRLLILLFDLEPMRRFDESETELVELLERLTVFSPNQAPDSLIQVKLKDLIHDQPLLYLFMNYLKTVRGPLNQLQFLLSAADWQQKYQDLKLEHIAAESERSTTEAQEEVDFGNNLKEELNYLHYEAWELFRNYFHEGGPDQIAFPEDLQKEFKEAVEIKEVGEAVKNLEKPVLKAHQLVYVWLQFSHMIPFCQSERYLEFLSGKRPELTAEDMAEYSSDRKARKKLLGNNLAVVSPISAQETAFSMAKLRNKFTGVFQMPVEEGSLLTPNSSADSTSGLSRRGSNFSDELGQGGLMEPARYEFAEVFPAMDTGERAILDEDLIELPGGIEGLPGALGQPMISESYSIDIIEDFLSEKDFNQWKVSIPRVEPRRDESGKTMYVYVVQVIRNDLAESQPNRQWTVDRKYGEFFVLESKLLEFHGEAVVAPFLPPKKTFVNKGRAFVESLRPAFDGFIQRLAGSPVLKRSELLLMFLTSSQEFTSSLVPDAINPWKAMKKMPGKLAREKGQNLTGFLNNFVQGSEVPEQNHRLTKSRSGLNWGSSQEIRSEHSANSMLSNVEKQKVLDTIYNSIYGNNCDAVEERSPLYSQPMNFGQPQPLTKSTYDLILFLGAKVFLAAKWLFVSLVSVRVFMRDTVDNLIKVFVRQKLKMALCEQRIKELIELLRDVIFYEESSKRTLQERMQRAEFSYSHSEEFLLTQLPKAAVQTVGEECMRKGLKQLFDCLQNPRLNKQLSYVLLDILLREIFPDMETVC